MASGQSFSIATASPLVGTLADPVGGKIEKNSLFRRYRAGVYMQIPDHGNTTSRARSIFYEIGRSSMSAKVLFARPPAASLPIDCSVDINAAEASNFEGTARRYSNFSPQWLKMDLAGMVERLAKGVAGYSLYQGVDSETLRGGQPLRITALGTLDAPQTASTNSVFIPRTIDTVGNDHVFAVLCAAANGEGASVATDVVRLDGNTNQPIVPAVAGSPFATACVEALRVLGANMEASGAGDIFAYALTRGIHSAVSVVSHTDEGGFMRNLLRADRFRTPYGGINAGLRDYPALPALASTSDEAVSAWVDAIALKTAAAVGHCDPLVPGDGGWYPTVFSSQTGELLPAGSVGEEPTDADARSIGRQIASDLGRFAPIYMGALTKLFGLHTNSGVASAHFCTVGPRALSQDNSVDRHLKFKTVAPYFWVEPTSLLAVDAFGTLAESEGYGAKVTPGHTASVNCFERFRSMAKGQSANCATVAFKMRTARTSGLVCALAADPAALADIKLYQFDTSSVLLPGDQGEVLGTVSDKHRVAAPLSSYLWSRGQSCFPAPAEFTNINGNYGAKVRVVTWDDDFNATLSDLPNDSEMEASQITWRVSTPAGLPSGPTNSGDRHARRARSRAAAALSQAVVRARAFGMAASPTMEVSEVPPTFDDAPAPFKDEAAQGGPIDPGRTTTTGEGSGVDHGRVSVGAPVPPVAHLEPQRAPQLPQRLGGHSMPAYQPQPGGAPPTTPHAGNPNAASSAGVHPFNPSADPLPTPPSFVTDGAAAAPAAPAS
ncbi:coat protein [Penicillium digitatum virus 1]|uniref:Coat protein n=1 Tax=Penicillium digitatum virus 1 TaxID=1833938 RepID=A0A165G7F1_9VIRU|nr:coat protein [Penicillium digitatum virus 1]AMY26885.1 coat protein [Penicillium digitatum virus 1]